MYSFEQLDNNNFRLFSNGLPLGLFSRLTIRDDLSSIASSLSESSHWIGSILRLFYENFPEQQSRPDLFPSNSSNRDSLSRYHDKALIQYLCSVGFTVHKSINASVTEVVYYLRSKGYVVYKDDFSKVSHKRDNIC